MMYSISIADDYQALINLGDDFRDSVYEDKN